MSSAYRRDDGKHEIAYYYRNPQTETRKRYKVTLGKITTKARNSFQEKLDELIGCRETGLSLDVDQRRWIRDLPADIHAKLAAAGLVKARISVTLGKVCYAHIKKLKQKNRKASTIRNIGMVVDNLRKYFGEDCKVRTLTTARATEFSEWLAKEGGRNGRPLAPSTVAVRCSRARQIFDTAVKNRWIRKGRNPFREHFSGDTSNPSRDEYIPWNEVLTITGLCTSPTFRLFLAMTRLCGIRSPSDVQPIGWNQIDWKLGIMRVNSQKNERHADLAVRYIPIFNALRPFLEDAYDAAPEGVELVFHDLQICRAALADRLESLCRKAGIPMWPKPLQNLRASGERDLWRALPYDEVAAILDHSPETAHRHYNRFAKDLLARAQGRALLLPDLDWQGAHPGARKTVRPGNSRGRNNRK